MFLGDMTLWHYHFGAARFVASPFWRDLLGANFTKIIFSFAFS